MIVPVILSGGLGTRLWPISTRFTPKPFITMPDGKRLIDKTYTRAAALGAKHIVTFTNQKLAAITQRVIEAGHASDNAAVFHLVLENTVKNTAPVIITAAKYIRRYISPDAVMLVMPADHVIENEAKFTLCVNLAADYARKGSLATFGISPTAPETNYGYIRVGSALDDGNRAFRTDGFTEKPNPELAVEYVTQGDYYWNAGIFCFHVDTIIEQYALYCPEMPDIADRSIDVKPDDNSTPYLQQRTLNADAFGEFRAISMDYAIMEHAKDVTMIRADFDWRDMGSWAMMREIVKKDSEKNAAVGNNMLIDCEDSFVWNTEKPLAMIGVKGVTVIDTFDGTLIVNNDHLDQIKKTYENFETQSDADCRERVLYHFENTTVTLIELSPGGTYRHTPQNDRVGFRVVSGIADVRIESGNTVRHMSGEPFGVPANKSIHIVNQGKTIVLVMHIES